MTAGELPGALLVVDPDGRLEPVTEVLQRAGAAPIQRVTQLSDADRSDIVAVLGLDAPASDSHPRQDGLKAFRDVRETFDSPPPVALYVLRSERTRINELLDAGVDDVIRVPPKREGLWATRIERLCGLDTVESAEQQLESMLDSYPETVYLKDCQGRFVNISRYSLDNREMTRTQRVGLTDYELFPGDLPDRLYDEEQELLAREETLFEKIEHWVEDGEDKWVSTTKAPRYDADGELLGLVGDVRDVTHLKRQEHALAMLHQASRRLIRADDWTTIAREMIEITADIDALPAARIVLEGDERIEETSGDTEIAWDETSFERATESGETLYLADDGSVLTGPERTAYEDTWMPDQGIVGVRLPLGDHGVFGIETSEGVLEPFDIELTHILAANVEAVLDRRRQEERATRQAERIEQFARIGSHELRNNLQIAMGATDRALAGDEVAGRQAIATLERMDRLTSQLMTLARTGSMTRGNSQVNLSTAAGKAAESVAGDLTVLADTGATVMADPDASIEILAVLFRNVAERDSSATVQIGITDDGFYVTDDASTALDPDASNLFEPVYTETSGQSDGSLYLVSVLADALGWTVSVSADGTGTKVSFEGVTVEP
jgi:PAS domain S-box-containing protein